MKAPPAATKQRNKKTNWLLIVEATKGIVICIPLLNHEIVGFSRAVLNILKRELIYHVTSILGEFHAWDNCTSIGISVIFYPCKQIKLY